MDKIIGPVTPSEHDSATDKTRPEDFAALSTTAPADLAALKATGKPPKLTPYDKQALSRLAGGVMEGVTVAGGNPQDAVAAAKEAVSVAKADIEDISAAHIADSTPSPARFELSKQLIDYQDNAEMRHDLNKSATFLAQAAAGFMEFTLLPETWRATERPDFEPDPTFDYMAIRDKAEAGRSAEDREWLRESVSEADLKHRQERLAEKDMNMQLIGAHGQGTAVLASLAGGVVDPAGWVLGFGVGKMAQLGGVGARVAMQAGQTGRALAYGAAEGGVGNVLYTAALDAAGQHVTYSDYVSSAAFGAGFGMVGGVASPYKSQGEATMRPIQEAAAETNHNLYARAQGMAGEGATPAQIAEAADDIVRTEVRTARDIANAPLPEADRLFPYFDHKDVDPQTGVILSLRDKINNDKAINDAASEWGISDLTVPDPADRGMLAVAAHRVKEWAANNPINAERLDTLFAKTPWLRTTSVGLARSSNDALRWVAGNLLESTTGAFSRRRTAAIDKTMLERQYMEPLAEYEDAYKAWRASGDSHPIVAAARDIMSQDQRKRWNLLVDADRRAAANNGTRSSNPHVRRANDALDAGYGRQAADQIDVGTIGSARLKGLSSVGYAPRRISPSWVLNATNEEVDALADALGRQMADLWSDFSNSGKFARQVAANMISRVRTQAYGGASIPANVSSPDGAAVVRDVLRAMAVPEEDAAKLLGRFSRGGAGHTKKRIDLDLDQEVALPSGKVFKLSDAYDNDHAGLYMRYARRVSGEVALTKYGIMGEQGLRQLRRLAEFGPDGKKATDAEMQHFDQIAAEFMGRALDGARPVKFLDNLRLLTASSRLGGMFFTQFAEQANAVGAVGVKGAMDGIASLPRMVDEIRHNKPNPLLDDIVQIGGPIGQDYRVVFPYQEAGDIRVYGQDSLNAFDRMVRAGSNAVPWLSGWHMLHGAQVRGMSEQIVHKAFRYIRDGKDDVALDGMGITKEVRDALRKDLKRIATFDGDTLTALNLKETTQPEAVAAFVQAVHRGAGQIIQGIFIGETGKWAHNDLLRLLVQFRSFSLTSMEKQWRRQRVDFGTAKAFGLLMGSMAFALPIHFARVQANAVGRDDREEYLDRQLSLDMMARATLNYASLSGGLGDVLDAGAGMLGYEMSGVRGGQKDFLDNVPGLGYINSTARAVQEKDPRDMIRALPGGNLPWLMPVFNQLD